MSTDKTTLVLMCLAIAVGVAYLPGCPGGGGTSVNGGGSDRSALLSWTAPSTQTDGVTPLAELTGYRVHYGTASRNYTTVIDVGNVTAYVLNDLPPGTYYFAVTAYNSNGDSEYSAEGSKTIQ